MVSDISLPVSTTKTVLVLGAAYGGNRAAQILAAGLPRGWRIVLVDRNTHFNHVYVMPRLAVLPGHENKAFIPYTRVFYKNTTPPPREENDPDPHVLLHAHVISVHPHHVILSKPCPEQGFPTARIDFDFLVYALGSQLPDPLNLWGPLPSTGVVSIPNETYNGTKKDSVRWLKENQRVIEESPSVLVVGGGALGIQFASDIANVYPTKPVTLLHSRHRLMPLYEEELHLEVMKGLEALGVNVILGERLDMSSVKDEPVKFNELGQRVVRTVKGRELAADYIMLCTGQKPNTGILKAMDESTINPTNNLAYVLRTMQLAVPTISPSKVGSPKATEIDITAPPPPNEFDADAFKSQSLSSSSSPEELLRAALAKIELDAKEALEKGFDSSSSSAASSESVTPVEEEEEEEEELRLWTPYPHIFCVGDSADAFEAIKAGHTAWAQGEVAGKNIVRMVKRIEGESEGVEEEKLELEEYHPGLPAIKVSLGLRKAAFSVRGVVGVKDDGVDDLQAPIIWSSWGYEVGEGADYEA